MATSESELEARLSRECALVDVLCYKFTSPSRSGVPDRMLIGYAGHEPRTIFVELKRPSVGRRGISAAQHARAAEMTAHGAHVYCVSRPQEVMDLLRMAFGPGAVALDDPQLAALAYGLDSSEARRRTPLLPQELRAQ